MLTERKKQLLELGSLNNLNDYQSNQDIIKFFKDVTDDMESYYNNMKKLKDNADEMLNDLTTESYEGKNEIFKLYPFNSLVDKLTIKSLYLSLKYYYGEELDISYTIYTNPDYLKMSLKSTKS